MIEPVVGGVLAGIAIHNAAQWWKRRALAPAKVVAAPAPTPTHQMHPVVAALAKAGRPLSNRELATALGCSEGHASRLRRQAGVSVATFRRGRCVCAALPGWQVH